MRNTTLKLTPALTALLIITVLITPPIYIGGIPFSLQPFIIALFALILDWKTALAIIALYILIGFLGLPVFSGGKNGAGVIAGGTIGFVIGFIPYSLIIALPKRFIDDKKKVRYFISILFFGFFATVVLYFSGFIYFHFASGFSFTVFMKLMTPFFFVDLLKINLALIISIIIRPLISQYLK